MFSEISKNMFGGICKFTVYNSDPVLSEPAIEAAYMEGMRLHKVFSVFDNKSEISQLNHKRKLKISEDLAFVLKKAIEISKLAGPEYNIGLGAAISSRKAGFIEKKVNPDLLAIRITDDIIELLDHSIQLDLGSIAKGYIVDKMVEILVGEGVEEGMIDARGDIRVFGDHETEIEIQHPRIKNKRIAKFKVREKGVATSGDYRQFYGSHGRSHILNSNDLISVTVIAPTLMEADVFSTALFVSKQRQDILRINKYPAFTIGINMNIQKYNGF